MNPLDPADERQLLELFGHLLDADARQRQAQLTALQSRDPHIAARLCNWLRTAERPDPLDAAAATFDYAPPEFPDDAAQPKPSGR